MPDRLHSLLRRQLKRCFGSVEAAPPECGPFLDLVSDAYQQADTDRLMVERSLELSSGELSTANEQLQQAVSQLQAAHRDMEARVIERTRALESANERLRQAQKMEAIGQLAGGIAHDFNNLLTVIEGSVELLLAGLEPGALDRRELEEIRRASQRASSLTRQLLAFGRKQVLEPKTVDLNQIVLGIQRMLTRVIREDITLTVDPSLRPAWVRVDPNQIEQVVLNFVLNAKDALPGGGDIRVDVADALRLPGELGPSGDERYVRLRVSDNGVGMPPEVREHIFEPFFTTKAVGKGTGLGLASAYGIIRQSGGFVAVDTAVGEGATFTVYIPAAPAPEASRSVGEVDDEDAVPMSETVLLVEDEYAVRRVLATIIQRNGYRVIETGLPDEALVIFQRQSADIDLLVTDVVMPGMDGPTLAKRLVAMRPELRVLFISGYADLDPETLGLDQPNLAFLAKPIQASHLAMKLRELAAARR